MPPDRDRHEELHIFLQQFLQIRARFLVALGIVAPVASPAAAKRCIGERIWTCLDTNVDSSFDAD